MRRILLTLTLLCSSASAADDLTARDLVEKAMDHWRGLTSWGISTMTIHRADWERSMTMESWSKGDKTTLVRVIEPRKDAGNATLLNDGTMWSFTPRINRIIKIPSSMMSQAWMGSDFSNKDIAKSTDIIDRYDHELTATETVDGHVQYTVTSVPHEDAAVVWGKEVLIVRDDFVLIEQQFWDQDGVLVKKMETLEVAEMGGRPVAKVLRMGEVDAPEEWTQLTTEEIKFDLELSDNLFTLSNLRNPRQ
ncbi:MAG: outer membrane lipoprotein-sorting protein [Lysobacterales bacterium]|jgi:outer membrane lipoprotein-sorting protein